MPKRSKEEWLTLFQQHEQSDLPASQFCQQNNLCPKYFSLRKKQLGWGGSTFVKVKAPVSVKPATVSSITLTIGHCRLQLPLSVSETWLANMVKALNA